MNTRASQILIGVVVFAGFVSALFGAAWMGIRAAERSLPDNVLTPVFPQVGDVVTLDSSSEPLYLAPGVQELRDFFFAFQTAESRREGDAEARQLRRVFESLEVRILNRDADAIEVEVLSGPLAGVTAWVHQDQFPPPGK